MAKKAEADRRMTVVRKLGAQARTDPVLRYWEVGRQLAEQYPDHRHGGLKRLAGPTGLSERQLQYCREVFRAFPDRENLRSLVAKGLGWSSVRELAGVADPDVLKAYVARFESGLLSNTALRSAVLRDRSDGQPMPMVRTLKRLVGRLRGELGELRRQYPDGFEQMLAAAPDDATRERITELEEELRLLVRDLTEDGPEEADPV